MTAIEKILSPQKRAVLMILGFGGLALVYLFQHLDVMFWLSPGDSHSHLRFIANRTIRLIFNDLFMLLLIAVWFQDRTITRLALFIQLIDFFILLPLYLYFKLTLEGDSEISSPMLSQFHRLVVNPTLMIMLVPAIYFQRLMRKNEG